MVEGKPRPRRWEGGGAIGTNTVLSLLDKGGILPAVAPLWPPLAETQSQRALLFSGFLNSMAGNPSRGTPFSSPRAQTASAQFCTGYHSWWCSFHPVLRLTVGVVGGLHQNALKGPAQLPLPVGAAQHGLHLAAEPWPVHLEHEEALPALSGAAQGPDEAPPAPEPAPPAPVRFRHPP